MEFKNDQKVESTIRYLYYFISAILCLFLILLTDKILDDLGNSVTRPTQAQFENKVLQDSLNMVKKPLTIQTEEYATRTEQLQKTSSLAEEKYENAKESFDNWLKARETIGAPSQDKEVISRAERLDDYYKIKQAWSKQLSLLEDTTQTIQSQLNALDEQVETDRNHAQTAYSKALQSYEVKVFFIRLLFILPILALGIFFYVRYRKHKFWPLYLGFTFFSLYAFFVGLIPYLPSYGGYVRYSVGILLSLAGGYYAIKNIRSYLEQRQAALKLSSVERSKNVESDTAFKAYDQHICPSCGKDFIFKNWVVSKPTGNEVSFSVSNYCRQCGLQLFKKCTSCSENRFAHLPYCSICGVTNTDSTPSV